MKNQLKKIFEYKYYNTVMYILISILMIAIIFNIMNITNSIKIETNNTKFTGYAVSESQNITNAIISAPASQKQELYSERSYGIYYLIIISVIMLISLVLVTFIIPRIKSLT